jgi:hypothetical protein
MPQDIPNCPECGSPMAGREGGPVETASGGRYLPVQCEACGHSDMIRLSPSVPPARPAPETVPSRATFAYHDGRAEGRADPIDCYYRLSAALKGRQAALLKQRKSREVEPAEAATDELLPAVRSVFQLWPECTDVDAMALLDGYLAWLAAEELRGREFADMVACFGADVLTFPYPLYIRLWLNLDRIRTQWAAAVAEGLGVATSNGRVNRAFLDAISATPAEGAELEFQVNSERAERRFNAKRGLV